MIDKVYRFEGASDPEDQSVLYAISSSKFNMKGVLVNHYGISADASTNAIIAKLKTRAEGLVKPSFIKKQAANGLQDKGQMIRANFKICFEFQSLQNGTSRPSRKN